MSGLAHMAAWHLRSNAAVVSWLTRVQNPDYFHPYLFSLFWPAHESLCRLDRQHYLLEQHNRRLGRRNHQR